MSAPREPSAVEKRLAALHSNLHKDSNFYSAVTSSTLADLEGRRQSLEAEVSAKRSQIADFCVKHSAAAKEALKLITTDGQSRRDALERVRSLTQRLDDWRKPTDEETQALEQRLTQIKVSAFLRLWEPRTMNPCSRMLEKLATQEGYEELVSLIPTPGRGTREMDSALGRLKEQIIQRFKTHNAPRFAFRLLLHTGLCEPAELINVYTGYLRLSIQGFFAPWKSRLPKDLHPISDQALECLRDPTSGDPKSTDFVVWAVGYVRTFIHDLTARRQAYFEAFDKDAVIFKRLIADALDSQDNRELTARFQDPTDVQIIGHICRQAAFRDDFDFITGWLDRLMPRVNELETDITTKFEGDLKSALGSALPFQDQLKAFIPQIERIAQANHDRDRTRAACHFEFRTGIFVLLSRCPRWLLQQSFKRDERMLKVLLAIVLASGADGWKECLTDCLMKCGTPSAMRGMVAPLLADIYKRAFFAEFDRAPVEALIERCATTPTAGS
jgi:hypothetical protein